jgi:hypothetical protein
MKLTSEDDYEFWDSCFNLECLVTEYEQHYRVFAPTSEREEIYLDRFKEDFRKDWKRKVGLFKENAKYIQFFVRIMRKTPLNGPYLQIPRGGIYTWKKV